MESLRSTSSRLPARIIMKISCGGCSQCGPSGQEPEHTPHCMHILTQLPSSTFASTSLRKSLWYFSTIALLRSVMVSPKKFLSNIVCRKGGRSRASLRPRHSYFLYSTKTQRFSVFHSHEIFFAPWRLCGR